MKQCSKKAIQKLQERIPLNIGIRVNVGKAKEDYAESMGKVVEELSDNEKKQAILDAVLAS